MQLDESVDIPDERPGADVVLETAREAERLSIALKRIEPRYADTISHFYFDGLTYDAIACREGVPANTLKSRVRRGLIQLRAELA